LEDGGKPTSFQLGLRPRAMFAHPELASLALGDRLQEQGVGFGNDIGLVLRNLVRRAHPNQAQRVPHPHLGFPVPLSIPDCASNLISFDGCKVQVRVRVCWILGCHGYNVLYRFYACTAGNPFASRNHKGVNTTEQIHLPISNPEIMMLYKSAAAFVGGSCPTAMISSDLLHRSEVVQADT
jgi:hypothetical protein